MQLVTTPDQIEVLLHSCDHFFIFKHSTQCPISAQANQEVAGYEAFTDSLPIHKILVIENRAVSNLVEQQTGIRHESPQLLLIKKGTVLWHASHRKCTAQAMQEATHDR